MAASACPCLYSSVALRRPCVCVCARARVLPIPAGHHCILSLPGNNPRLIHGSVGTGRNFQVPGLAFVFRSQADLYTKCDLKDRALEEHEAAYDELCQLKGEQSEDVQTVQQFLDSFLITCGKATEGGPEALCGNWVRNRKANKSILQ